MGSLKSFELLDDVMKVKWQTLHPTVPFTLNCKSDDQTQDSGIPTSGADEVGAFSSNAVPAPLEHLDNHICTNNNTFQHEEKPNGGTRSLFEPEGLLEIIGDADANTGSKHSRPNEERMERIIE